MNLSENETEFRRLYRSKGDYVLAGIAGGLGEYFKIDPVIIRVIFVLFGVFSGGVFLLGYLVLILIIPRDPGK